MSGRVEGKVALVTGAEGGMGFADAVLLDKEGAIVYATDLKLSQLKENYKEESDSIHLAELDVTKPDHWQKVVDEIIEKHGKIDVLVNNAGIFDGTNIVETTTDILDKVMKVNVNGIYLGMKTVIPHMQKNGEDPLSTLHLYPHYLED